ncbi:MAG: cytochrome c biogenesis protein CcdA, partial [Kiritimatiellales bacterium]|nr:cytochrome c biogenesis protein CcdA [Kiritimatiellales bacterium]
PCHLASIPLIVAYVNGQDVKSTRHAAGLSTLFSVGILIMMAVIGVITALAGRMTGDAGSVGGYMMSAVFILIGLHLMDVISIPWFGTRKEKVHRKGAWGALMLGVIFGFASGPCTFAFLAPVLAVVFNTAADNTLFGAALLALYGLGHCAVLIIAGTSVERAQHFANWNRETKTAARVKSVFGVLLILAGLYFLYKTL